MTPLTIQTRTIVALAVIIFQGFAGRQSQLIAQGAAPPSPPISINVQDFGAKGDGLTDDTAAIQSAANSIGKYAKTYPRPVGGCYPELLFPEGTYLVSKSIVLGLGPSPERALEKGKPSQYAVSRGAGFIYVRGVGKVTIKQSNPKADIFYIGLAYRMVIESLGFDGGFRSINMWTANIDMSFPIVRNCNFANAGSYAIQTPYIRQNEAGDFLGYAEVKQDGSMAEKDEPSGKHFLYHSTFLHVTKCGFRNCIGVLFTAADMAVMENCNIETHPEMKGAAIRVAGMLKLEKIEGLAHVRKGYGQRWIDLDFGTTNWVLGRNLKLSTDSSTGLCVLYSQSKFRLSGPVNPNSIVFEDSAFKVSGCPENAVIYCKEVPNIISVSHCKQTGQGYVPVLGFPKPLDANYFRAKVDPGGVPINPGGLAYLIDDGNVNLLTDLPLPMKPYARRALQSDVAQRVRTWLASDVDDFISEDGMATSVKKRINAIESGAKGDGVTDDTAAIQKIMTEAKGSGGAEIVFPGAAYKISETINLPSNILIRGSGRAVFVFPDKSSAGFSAPEGNEIGFFNCAFESGGTSVGVRFGKQGRGRVLFDNCSFSNANSAAIECLSDAPSFVERTQNRLRATNCIFYNSRQSVRSNIDAELDSCWIEPYFYRFSTGENIQSARTWESAKLGYFDSGDPFRDLPVIWNDGNLRMQNIAGCPTARGLNRDLRWIDNCGRLICDYVRFGGESGGLSAVNILPSPESNGNVVVIQNSWNRLCTGSFYYPGDKMALIPQTSLVSCSKIPDLLVLRNNTGVERSYPPATVIGETIRVNDQAAQSALKSHLFMSNNIIPENVGYKKGN